MPVMRGQAGGPREPCPPDQGPHRALLEPMDLFVLVLVVLALAKAALTRAMALGGPSAAPGAYLEIALVAGLILIAAGITRRPRPWLPLIVYALLSLVMLGNAVYASYYEQVFDPQMLSMAGQLGSVADVIREILAPVDLLFVIDLPFLIAWAVLMRCPRARMTRLVALGLGFALVAVFAGQAWLVLRASAGVDGTTLGGTYGIAAMQAASYARVEAPGVVSAETPTFAGETEQARERSAQDQIRDVLGPYSEEGSRVADFEPGAYKGAPIIIVQWEALQSMLVSATVDGQPVVPNATTFAEQSWYFPDFFSQTGSGNTADAEFVMGTSMLPPLAMAASVGYSDRKLPAYPRLLRNAGYDVETMHANEAAYWNRKELYPALGFTRFIDRSGLPERDYMWKGVSDDVLFDEALSLLQERSEDTSRPIALQVITLSSHTPFIYPPDSRRPLELDGDKAESFTGKYLTAESYTDEAFGRFVQGLKDTGLWDKAVVIVYGDHMGVKDLNTKGADAELMQQVLGRPYTHADRQRVPLMIHLPGQTEGTQVNGVRGMQDIMPTIADLVGTDLETTPHFGRTVFEDGKRIVPMRAYFPGGSFITDEMVFVKGASVAASRALRISDGTEMAVPASAADDIARVQRMNAVSDAWIRSRPRRQNAGSAADAIIPTKGGRGGDETSEETP